MSALLQSGTERRYVLAGRAVFTIVSQRTGVRYTYRVKAAKARPGNEGRLAGHAVQRIWFVSVLTGPDNTRDYRYAGIIAEDSDQFHTTRNAKISPDAPSVVAFKWFWRNVDALRRVDVYHEGACGCCGRTLTTPESVASGIGPVCAGRMP